ncbi:MAG: hypothetical protein CVU11_02025 [Bacteroidetes bacterium HGW-Bacteroidetes-6]|jgi:3-dehydroquinate synthase|nr:MAG: hypothetical protein CVU11_02025 [Bacteroidetes bacterium HGW-Bacteroidetes-6]
MENNTITRIGNKISPVYISGNPQKDFKRLWQLHVGSHLKTPVVLLADKKVYSLHKNLIDNLLSSIKIEIIDTEMLEAGEGIKQLSVAESIISKWSSLSVPKNTVVLCIGGGTITDLGGFAASVFKRGLRLINIPSSLMAMTDASIGGKNALNLGAIKNQIGTFHLPLFTFSTPVFLNSLPAIEMASGYAEIMKHGLLEGKNFLRNILKSNNLETAPSTALLTASVRIKMHIVTTDPNEKSNRIFLNLGHTFGHAYEGFFAASGNPITHGHSVAIGLCEILQASKSIYGLDLKAMNDVETWIKMHFSISSIPSWEEIEKFIAGDKKNVSEIYRIVLLKKVGSPIIKKMNKAELISIHKNFRLSID